MGLVGTNYCATVVTVCYSGCQATCSHTPSNIAGLGGKEGAPGIEPGTSQSAVECFTTELCAACAEDQ